MGENNFIVTNQLPWPQVSSAAHPALPHPARTKWCIQPDLTATLKAKTNLIEGCRRCCLEQHRALGAQAMEGLHSLFRY